MDEARDGHGMVPEQAAAFLLFAELSSPASVPPGGGERRKRANAFRQRRPQG